MIVRCDARRIEEIVILYCFFFFQTEDGIRDISVELEFGRVLFRSKRKEKKKEKKKRKKRERWKKKGWKKEGKRKIERKERRRKKRGKREKAGQIGRASCRERG